MVRHLSAVELAVVARTCRGMRAAATRAAREAARAVLGGFEVEEEEEVSWIAAAREAELRQYCGVSGKVAVSAQWLMQAGDAWMGLRIDGGDGREWRGMEQSACKERLLQVAVGYNRLAAVTLGGELLVGRNGRHGQLGLGNQESVQGTLRRVGGPLAGLLRVARVADGCAHTQ